MPDPYLNTTNTSFKEYFIYSVEDTALTGGTGVAFEDSTLRFDRDSNFEINKMMHVATDDRIYLKISDDAYGRFYSNEKIDLRHISGKAISGITANGFLPFIMPAPMVVKGGTNMGFAISDFSGSSNSLRLSMHGAKIKKGVAPWQKKYRARVPFFYTKTATISGNGTANFAISINFDADFLVHRITGNRTGAALITVQDGSADRSWMDKAVHLDNFIGNSQFPNILFAPRYVKFGSVINISVQDLTGSSNSIGITFIGEKLYI